MIVGLTGLAGSGKSEAALRLVSRHGFTRTRFAGPFKAMMHALLSGAGVDHDTARRMIDGDLKEVPSPALSGCSPRHAMQTLGTEWGRMCLSPSFWVDVWRHAAAGIDGPIVVDDVRFANEAAAIRDMGGVIVKVARPGVARMSHASEQERVSYDFRLLNDSCVTALHRDVDNLVSALGRIYDR